MLCKTDKGVLHREWTNLLVYSTVLGMQDFMIMSVPAGWKPPTQGMLMLDKLDISKAVKDKLYGKKELE